jgi:hypothetical protein
MYRDVKLSHSIAVGANVMSAEPKFSLIIKNVPQIKNTKRLNKVPRKITGKFNVVIPG